MPEISPNCSPRDNVEGEICNSMTVRRVGHVLQSRLDMHWQLMTRLSEKFNRTFRAWQSLDRRAPEEDL